MDVLHSEAEVIYDRGILQFPPNVAIEIGFSMYTADSENATPTARSAASLAMDDFQRQLQQYEVNAPERVYLGSVLRAAISFARGVKRRKDELAHNLANLKEEKDRALAHVADTERSSSILIGAFQLVLLGGAVWLLLQGLATIPRLEAILKASPNGPNYFSLAFAMASALAGSFYKHWRVSRELRNLFRWYERERDGAYKKYSESVRHEYELAADTASLAWKALTGESPNVTRAFAQLLEGLFPDYRGVAGYRSN